MSETTKGLFRGKRSFQIAFGFPKSSPTRFAGRAPGRPQFCMIICKCQEMFCEQTWRDIPREVFTLTCHFYNVLEQKRCFYSVRLSCEGNHSCTCISLICMARKANLPGGKALRRQKGVMILNPTAGLKRSKVARGKA